MTGATRFAGYHVGKALRERAFNVWALVGRGTVGVALRWVLAEG